MTKIYKDVYQKIKDDEIDPIPRWIFEMRGFGLWLIVFILIATSSISWGLVIHSLLESDWDIYSHLDRTYYEHLLYYFPFFWFILAFAALFVAWYHSKQSKLAYQLRNRWLLCFGLIFCLLVGISLSATGVGFRLEQKIPSSLSANTKVLEDWSKPEQGLLVGSLEQIKQNNYLFIKDKNGRIWQIKSSQPVNYRFIGENWRIKIIGTKESESIFKAIEIRAQNQKNGKTINLLN